MRAHMLAFAASVALASRGASAEGVFSRYTLDGTFIDSGVAGNSLSTTFTPDDDSVCDGSLLLEDGDFYKFKDPEMVPIGSESWTMSIYAKCIQAPDTRSRIFMHLGSDDSSTPYQGIGIGVDSSMRLYFNYYTGDTTFGVEVDYNWHQYAMTYDNSTLSIYVDELLVHSVDVELNLTESSKYGTMSIGDRHTGGTKYARDGIWLFDEAVFGNGVVDFDTLRAPCAIEPRTAFSRYPLDGDFVDTAPAGNSLSTTFTPDSDYVCGGSLRLEDGDFYKFSNPSKVPTGSESWTMALYAKCIEAPDTRSRIFTHLGADDSAYQGIGFGVNSASQLYVYYYTSEAVVSGVEVDYDWHQYVMTYDSTTLKVYMDELLVHSVDVELNLTESSKYGTMSIGDRHTGGTKYARDGIWLFDEVVFGTGVVDFDTLRAPCAVFSRYPLDGDFVDTASAGNSLSTTFTPDSDSVCDGSLRLEDGDFYKFKNPSMVPTGSESWTMAIYAKCIEAPDTRSRIFAHLGADDTAYQGIGFGVDSSSQLYVYYYTGMQTVSGVQVDSNWHQYVMTYDSTTLKVYVDELLVHSVAVELDLAVSSKYGTMSIGDRHTGGTKYARDGIWLFDEAVFGNGVVGFDTLRAPC